MPRVCREKRRLVKWQSANGLPLELPELLDHRSERQIEACT